MAIERVSSVGPARIDVAYERLGDPAGPPVVLIMGLALQLTAWPDGLCDALVARGLQVIRFDNRDAGESTHFSQAPVPDLLAVTKGDLSSASYRLSDMAADTVGLLDALGLDGAHLVGISLGGQIAQTVAIEHRARVRSLTVLSSTTGDPRVGQANPETLRALFGGPPATTREEVAERQVRGIRLIGSPGYPVDEDQVRERALRAYDRSHDPLAIARQAVASVASGDRTERLRQLDVPTLVIHGDADVMVDPSGGRAIAAAVPGAELVIIEGLGHNLPPGVWPRVATLIAGQVERVEG